MTTDALVFDGPLAEDLTAFLAFKRARGNLYRRAAFTLRSFDRYLLATTRPDEDVAIEQAILGWFGQRSARKSVSVANEMGVIRQFCLFRRRRDPTAFVPGRVWAPQSTESTFLPHIFSEAEVQTLLALTAELPGVPRFAFTIRTLMLVLYCTGLRFGEAVRLNLGDVDLPGATFYITESKGRSRYVPFGSDLAGELAKYLAVRGEQADGAIGQFFVRADGSALTVRSASSTVVHLLRKAGIKPMKGRAGPRPYDFRHTFAVRRF
jgi:integrase